MTEDLLQDRKHHSPIISKSLKNKCKLEQTINRPCNPPVYRGCDQKHLGFYIWKPRVKSPCCKVHDIIGCFTINAPQLN